MNVVRVWSVMALTGALFLSACSDDATAPSGIDRDLEIAGKKAPKEGDSASTIAPAPGKYVLTAPRWGKKQAQAVKRAGGEIVFSHGASGVGVVVSGNPDFVEDARSTRAFSRVAADIVVEWQPPIRSSVLDPSMVTPGDEGFFPFQWNMQAIEAPAAWAEGYDGSGVRVAVIDGGINDSHIDLAGQVDAVCSTSFVEGVPFNSDIGDPRLPAFWHGTHVAGIVAAADNGVGVIGVAPGATIMGVKALHGGSGSFGAVIGAILFASDPGAFPGFEGCDRADIINMSLGAAFPKSTPGGGPLVAALNKAVNFAGSNGVLVLASAGNSATDLGQSKDLVKVPAQSGDALAVSATGPTNFIGGSTNYRRIASYTDFGEDLVYVAGPGGDSVDEEGLPFDLVLSLCGGLGGASYCFAAGTSMASPAAAGVAALIAQSHPGISRGALKTKLKNTADDEGKRGKDEFYGHGFVNAFRGVTE